MTTLEESTIKASLDAAAQEFRNEEYRYAYAEDFLDTWIATQIVTLREQRGLSQSKLGELIDTKQPGVSRLENVNHSKWRCETLKRIARALGVRLKITFETFGTLLDEDRNFSREYLERPSFADDPVFSATDDQQPATRSLEIAMSRLLVKAEALNVNPNDALNVSSYVEQEPGIGFSGSPAGYNLPDVAANQPAANAEMPNGTRKIAPAVMAGYMSRQVDIRSGAASWKH